MLLPCSPGALGPIPKNWQKVIGGLSYLVGQSNTVYASNSDARIRLGSLNTLNKMNTSINIGAGIETKVFKSFSINLEFLHKYHIQTYKSSSINLNPFTLNYYIGLKYKL